MYIDVAQASSLQESEEEESDSEEEAEDAGKMPALRGFSLVFDVVHRFAQPLGIELSKWEGRVIETKKGAVRLLPVTERAKQLFGQDGGVAVADWIEQDPAKDRQLMLFPELEQERAAGADVARRSWTRPPSSSKATEKPPRSTRCMRRCCFRRVGKRTPCVRSSRPAGARPGEHSHRPLPGRWYGSAGYAEAHARGDRSPVRMDGDRQPARSLRLR